MTEPERPTIEFPCDYPIKVIGDSSDDFHDFVVEVARRHDPRLEQRHVTVNPSRNGRFLSVRLVIRATGESQISALFAELKESGRVRMVL